MGLLPKISGSRKIEEQVRWVRNWLDGIYLNSGKSQANRTHYGYSAGSQ